MIQLDLKNRVAIITGIPPGVGMGKKPKLFLKAVDELRLSIDNLGEQNSKIVSL